MKIFEKPQVYIAGIQQTTIEINHFLADHGITWETDASSGAETLSEVAGRICYMSFAKPRPGGNSAYINHIMEVGHGSVLEHAVVNFIFCGVSRSFTHELVRHRAGWGYSQLSQRYVDESVCEVVAPPDLVEEILSIDHEIGILWRRVMQDTSDAYRRLVDYLTEKMAIRLYEKSGSLDSFDSWVKANRTEIRKAARGPARSVLPNATETKIFCTANVRALRHFFEMRGVAGAEAEIRGVAVELCRQMKERMPVMFGDFEIEEGCLVNKYRKV